MKLTELLIDSDTGEVANESVYKNGIEIVDGVIYLPSNSKEAAICGKKNISKLSLSDSDFMALKELLNCVCMTDNIIYAMHKTGPKRPAIFKDLQEILVRDEGKVVALLRRLINYSILNTMPMDLNGDKQMCYVFNPYYFNFTNTIPLNVYKLFKEQMEIIFDKETQRWIERHF